MKTPLPRLVAFAFRLLSVLAAFLPIANSHAQVSEDWHRGRFVEFMGSPNQNEAQAVLRDWLGFTMDMDQIRSLREPSYSLYSDICARLAWIEKVNGNEAEFQRLLQEAVLYQRYTQLQRLRQDRQLRLDHSHFSDDEAEARKAQQTPPTRQEMYDVLHTILTLDRETKVRWIVQSQYDFDGFLATLKAGGEP